MMSPETIRVNPEPSRVDHRADDSRSQRFIFRSCFFPFLLSWLPYSRSSGCARDRTRHRFGSVGWGKISSLNLAMRFLMKWRLACES
jgi:hypothetical protein